MPAWQRSLQNTAHITFTATRWAIILVPMAICAGSLVALFLWLLEVVTSGRFAHPAILYGLPCAGMAVAALYQRIGSRSEGGNNLIIDQIHEPGGGVPLRMAPLVLFGTVISHLFGASVGREGTAVQIGGSLASGFAQLFRLDTRSTGLLLTAGIAAGFGAVFGTPVAGAIFALEVLTLGRLDYAALLPVAVASIVADWTCHAWGIHHTAYHVGFRGIPAADGSVFHVNALLLCKTGVAAIAFGFAARSFAESVHRLGAVFRQICPQPWLRPAIGGTLTILLVWITGTHEYLGLGVTNPDPAAASIVSFFGSTHYPWSWALKLIFTVIVLACGYKGGEVTPLFFIGAGLGNALAPILHVPADLLAGVGFVAVFAGAANTPLACTFMAVELFGATDVVYYAAGCFIAYLTSGHTGIYLAQRVGTPKMFLPDLKTGISLRQLPGK
ncbi:voltage-gated chloride channel family protein [Acetobacter fallax]|uniref:Voltage-gated chloride channel protein n=1 Tax=Acetobacter fallax TaxID=1737473 RepID=A0ABX0KE61_9PROT|nr:voltage-gated chloride channel family protein [Acetobacter fallax]NHO32237.1 voltage-gated chloride channel protein [Acetobacter fallax]NHO35710.1 voltage-gated chloride channel protein [Acetobacter fallax]